MRIKRVWGEMGRSEKAMKTQWVEKSVENGVKMSR